MSVIQLLLVYELDPSVGKTLVLEQFQYFVCY